VIRNHRGGADYKNPPRRACQFLKSKIQRDERMRRIISLVVLIVFIAISSAGLAFFMIKVNKAGVLLSGKVSEIEKCPQKALVTLSLPDGQSFRFSSTNQKLNGVHVGDRITVSYVKGRAAYIKKTGMKMAKTGPG
jgi:hypothetical protein